MNASILHRVLVPLDGSLSAEAVLSHLRRILPRQECEVVLFQSVHLLPRSEEHDAEKYLRRISFQLIQDGYPSRSRIGSGRPEDSILDAAAEERASLIALTTHGRTGAARWILGSVAERILQVSPLPVLVVHSLPKTLSRGKLEARPLRRFLVPLDGSRLSLSALGPILELARPVDAQVTLLHVSEPSPFDGRWDPPDATLEEADRILREACIPASVDHRKGDPGEQILNVAVEKEADLVAMTTHGRTGPSRWIYGSVTARVLRSGSVPLLVVRPAPGSPAPLRGTAEQAVPRS